MCKTCVFCSSPPVAWPQYTTDYVKGFDLCEYHMGLALRVCYKEEYNPEIKKREDIKASYSDELARLIENYFDTRRGNEGHEEILDEMYHSVYEGTWSDPVDYGKPIKVYTDDEQMTRWVTMRITSLSTRQKPYRRCSGFRESKPDNRCFNHVDKEGDLCPNCIERNRVKIDSLQLSDKTKRILDMMLAD